MYPKTIILIKKIWHYIVHFLYIGTNSCQILMYINRKNAQDVLLYNRVTYLRVTPALSLPMILLAVKSKK